MVISVNKGINVSDRFDISDLGVYADGEFLESLFLQGNSIVFVEDEIKNID